MPKPPKQRGISHLEKAYEIPIETRGTYKIPAKTIEIPAEGVRDSKEWIAPRPKHCLDWLGACQRFNKISHEFHCIITLSSTQVTPYLPNFISLLTPTPLYIIYTHRL